MQTSHTAPSTDKPAIRLAHNHLYSQVDAAVAAAEGRAALSAMVLVLLPLMRALGTSILRQVIQHRDRATDQERKPVPCPGCQGPLLRTRHLRSTRRNTLLGLLTYERRNYLCSICKRSEYPTDWGLDVLERLHGHSQEFASIVVLMTTLMPNAKAMDLFQKCFGFVVSTTLARGLTIELGTELFRQERACAEHYWALRTKDPEAIEPVPAVLRKMKRAKRKYVMTDDSKLGIQDGKRGRGAPRRIRDESKEAKALRKVMASEKAAAAKAAKRGKPGPKASAKMPKVAKDGDDSEESGFRNVRALLIFDQEDLAGVSKGRHEILRRRVVAHIGTLEEWYKFVHMALVEEGVYTAEEVFVIADGGAGIWEMFDEMLPTTRERRVHQVLDFYHASSYAWAAARAYKGNETSAQRKACIRWVQPLLADLRAGKVSNVIQRLAKLKLKGRAAEEVDKTKGYFETHRKRMRYAWVRDQGALIGSGAMESVHAWVIQARCRLPGMRWSVAGANAMLRLRCAWASGSWDESLDRAGRGQGPPIIASAGKKAA